MSGETEKQVSGWTVDTLKEYVERVIADLRSMLAERYATQTKAVDAAFLAQQTAMQTALTAAERAVSTALLAAEKAVGKAEVAAEKRFESVNEFRGQLTDQAATFIRRDEADVRLRAIGEKLDTETARTASRINELELRITSRLDLATGGEVGGIRAAETRKGSTAQMIAIASLVLFLISVVASIYFATRR